MARPDGDYLVMTPERRCEVQEVIVECTTLHEKLHRLRMHKTGHAMHDVVRAIGFEFEEQMKGGGES